MFKKRENDFDNAGLNYSAKENISKHKTNIILKGSKLTGDILISHDIELEGDVEGTITSEQQSNIVIRGNCKGSINVKKGNVDIEGQMSDGDIVAGGNVSVTGTFNGGKIEAEGNIFVNGQFIGTLKGGEIEVGPDARGTGEFLYRESISIAKGAIVEVQVRQTGHERQMPKELADAQTVNNKPPLSEAMGAQG
jgi:cytoskeletal protein CcmA (bactofilin family)